MTRPLRRYVLQNVLHCQQTRQHSMVFYKDNTWSYRNNEVRRISIIRLLTYPKRLKSCITISSGRSGEIVIGVWFPKWVLAKAKLPSLLLTLFTHGQNWMHSPAVVGAKYSSCSSSSWDERAKSTPSCSWCLALNKQGIFPNLRRFFRARSDRMMI